MGKIKVLDFLKNITSTWNTYMVLHHAYGGWLYHFTTFFKKNFERETNTIVVCVAPRLWWLATVNLEIFAGDLISLFSLIEGQTPNLISLKFPL